MRTYNLIGGIAAMCFVSCVAAPISHVPKEFAVEFKGNFSLEERVKLQYAFRVHKKAWESNFGLPSRKAKIIIVREKFERKGRILIGLCYSKKQLIKVYMGKNYELPALYHELCHLNVDHSNDHDYDKFPWRQWLDDAYVVRQKLCQNSRQ